MPLRWFDTSEAAAAGAALAEHWALPPAKPARSNAQSQPAQALQELLRRADREVRPLQLNFFKRAKLANAFKWKLLEKGVAKQTADDVTQALVMHLMLNSSGAPSPSAEPGARPSRERSHPDPRKAGKPKQLLHRGNANFAKGDYQQALLAYQDLVELKPRGAEGHNNLGATFYKLDRAHDAEDHLRQAVKLKPDYPEALSNLGAALQRLGQLTESEQSLRRALKLRSNYADARSLLGKTLALEGRSSEARVQFERALKIAPQHVEALLGIGMVAAMEGRFEEADARYQRVLDMESTTPAITAQVLAAQSRLRRMNTADRNWLERSQQVLAGGVPSSEESGLLFAIGKYYDDVGHYARAFQSYQRANELVKSVAIPYRREVRTQFVEDVIGVYDSAAIGAIGQGGTDSRRPVFIVGMPRSGTTLAEQIIASHPAAAGVGELEFWNLAGREYESIMRHRMLDEPLRKKLALEYLKTLSAHPSEAIRVVDKAPMNFDYLGVIHAVFPQAHIIYMRRNPIDTCLSCYFQPFLQLLSFTMDLSDLEHYYQLHHRIMKHWLSVLPPGTIMEVPYEGLVANQTAWTRKMLEFIGLDWDGRCLDFHSSPRGVATASAWQVRQKIYATSVERWRHYEKFIGPLMGLRKLDA